MRTSLPAAWALLLGGFATASAAPTVDDALGFVRQGRLAEAEPVLARALSGPAPDRLRAVRGLVQLAQRRADPWKVLSLWRKGAIGGVEVPEDHRNLLELELELSLGSWRAKRRLAGLDPDPWSPEFQHMLTLVQRHLEPATQRETMLRWVRTHGGPARADARLILPLGEQLESLGRIEEAARLYRDHLLSRDVQAEIEEATPLRGLPGLEELAGRVHRTHTSPAARRRLHRELVPDQNLGWLVSLRGWMRLAWAMDVVSDRAAVSAALRQAEAVLKDGAAQAAVELAGLSLHLGHPARAARLYAAALSAPPAEAPALARGRLLLLLSAARWRARRWDAAIRGFWEASRLDTDLTLVHRLVRELPPEERPHRLLTGLVRVPARRGLGPIVAESMNALGMPGMAVAPMRATLREAPRAQAQEALAWLLDQGLEAVALTDLTARDDWHSAPEEYLGSLAGLTPDAALAGPMARLLAALPGPVPAGARVPLGRLLVRWREALPGVVLDAAATSLPPAHREIRRLAGLSEEPGAAPPALLAGSPDAELVAWWVELVFERGWKQLADSSLESLEALPMRREARRQVLLARARLAFLLDQSERALLRGLRALEATPGDEEILDFLTGILEDKPAQRRVLQAWAAHVENDHRYALSLNRLWKATERPWRGIGPLRRARRAQPRSPEIAAALGRLLQETRGDDDALPHLVAAARLAQFRYREDYSPALGLTLARLGQEEKVLRVYRHWLRAERERPELAGELLALGGEWGFPDKARGTLEAAGVEPPLAAPPEALPGD